MSIDKGMDKDVVLTWSGLLLSHREEWNNAICSDMDRPRDYHTEWGSHTEKDKYMVSLINGI